MSFRRFGVLGLVTVLSLGMLSADNHTAGSDALTGPRLIAFLHATVIPMHAGGD